MKIGYFRFSYYLDQLRDLLQNAGKEKDPATWLFKNNARTPFFMLEALARLYEKMHDRKKFGRLRELFKLMEDCLGKIDYYNFLDESFRKNSKIPDAYKGHARKQLRISVREFNELLVEKGWLTKKRINKIHGKLRKVSWQDPAKDVDDIKCIYKSTITGIMQFVEEIDFHFDNVEEDVHELRRKMRWLSIYPQALRGTVQYAPDSDPPEHLKKYLTEEIVNSPYNKLPGVGRNTHFLILDRNYFLSLSWMIAKLGDLKDEGLLLAGLTDTIMHKDKSGVKEAGRKALRLLDSDQKALDVILREAEEVTRTYFMEKNLQNLLAGKGKLSK